MWLLSSTLSLCKSLGCCTQLQFKSNCQCYALFQHVNKTQFIQPLLLMDSCAVSNFFFMNSALMNILGCVFWGTFVHIFFFFFNIYLGVELLGHKEYTCSTLAYAAEQFSKAAELVWLP